MYKKGDHNIIDDITGFKIKASEAKMLHGEQEGLLTHKDNWNPPHPQLYIRPREDRQEVQNVRARPATNFITTPISEDDL